MAESIRVFRRRIKSVQSTKKITRAMELIAASRIVKAQQQVAASKPYAEEITRVVTAVATASALAHPLTTEREGARSAAVLVVTSDRGLAGAYSANALKTAEGLLAALRAEGKQARLYVIGRKGVAYFRFRGRDIAAAYTGFSEQPRYANAKASADELIEAFLAGSDAGGVDEIHLVFTQFASMLSQHATAVRVLPLAVTERAEPKPADLPAYELEPEGPAVLDALLPRYVESRIFAALLESAASESASRRRAMKAASDNADDLIRSLTRQANQARQAQITQEISEIVGGADALASAQAS